MTNEQPEPLRLADSIGRMDTFTDYQREELNKAAAMLRKLYVHNTELENSLIKKSIAIQKIWEERDELRKQQVADEALLRQCLEYLERSADNYPVGHALSRLFHEQAIASLRDRLGEKE